MTPATVEQVMAQAEESIALVETASSALIDALQTELANALEMANQLIAQKERAEAQRDGLVVAARRVLALDFDDDDARTVARVMAALERVVSEFAR